MQMSTIYQRVAAKLNLPEDRVKKVFTHVMKQTMELITKGNRPVILFHGFGKIHFNIYAMAKYLQHKPEDKRVEGIHALATKLKKNKTRTYGKKDI